MKQAQPANTFLISEAVAILRSDDLMAGVYLPAEGRLAGSESLSLLPDEAGFCGAQLDSRLLRAAELFVALPGESVHGRAFVAPWLQQGGWVLTDVVAGDDPLLGLACGSGGGVLLSRDPIAALAALAGSWRDRMDVTVIGVTGTNGKTTTKDFLAAALSGGGLTHATAGNFNNALGLPLTLLGLRAEHRFAVIEMGASAQGEIDSLAKLARPDIGVITNAAPAHLAAFGSLAGIISGKGELLDHLPETGAAVLNTDSPGWQNWYDRATCRVISLGRTHGEHQWSAEQRGGDFFLILGADEWPVPLPGEHNAFNLAVAILVARDLGLTEAAIRTGLASFVGSPHRGIVLSIAGRTVLDDAYNANPDSMLAAVEALCLLAAGSGSGRTFAVLGMMAELGADEAEIHRQTGKKIGATELNVLVAVGAEAQPLLAGFSAAGGDGYACDSVAEVARWLANNTSARDCLLIKGSRSAAMETILPLLAEACGNFSENQD